ncbi:hypothetical protein ACHQM5_008331 [Ranunculus cassubicifolius]
MRFLLNMCRELIMVFASYVSTTMVGYVFRQLRKPFTHFRKGNPNMVIATGDWKRGGRWQHRLHHNFRVLLQ